jgi:hypothetical protein
MSLLLAIFLKPFIAVMLLVPVRLLVWWVDAKMPDSKLKRTLFSPLSGQRSRRH